MKKSAILIPAIILWSVNWVMGANTLIFDDHNTTAGAFNQGTASSVSFSPSASAQTFSFDISINITSQPPPNMAGFSLWFETSGVNSGLFTITANPVHTGSAFDQVTASNGDFPAVLTTTGTNHPGFAQNSAVTDLGATSGTDQSTAGSPTYFLETITFTIAANTPPGTYTLMNTSAITGHPPGQQSRVNDGNAVAYDIGSSPYTVTIVPEPATWSLFGLGSLGAFGFGLFRSRHKR